MVNPVRVTSLLLAMMAFVHSASAQTPQDSRITVAHPGFTLFKSDLKLTIDLATPGEQKQWENIQGFIDSFIIGIDETREVQVQVMTGIDPAGYLICVPLVEERELSKQFRENIDALGYGMMRDPMNHSLYSVESDADEYGFTRVDPAIRYAFFMITTNKADLPKLKEIVLKAALVPTVLKENMIAELKNTDPSPAAIAHRIAAFKPIRDRQLALIKLRPDEKPTAFQLRQASNRQLYDEAERLMSQTDQMLITLTMDRNIAGAPKVNLRTTVTAIPGTATDATIAQYSGLNDAFVGLQRLKGSAMSVRVNHPLDQLRKMELTETLKLTRADIEAGLTANKTRTNAEKAAFTKFVTGIVGVLEASVQSGHLNGFIESIPNGEANSTTIAAFVSPKAGDLKLILPLLTEAGKGNAVQMNVEKVGDVDIHKIQIADGFISLFDRFFGSHDDMFVGVGPQRVWIATGKDALDTLKSTITAVGEPGVNPVALKIEGNLLPWVQRIDATAKADNPAKSTADEEKLRRERARVRERALAALAIQDDISLVVSAEKGMWVSEFTGNTGTLRFVGKMMSAFSKENFE